MIEGTTEAAPPRPDFRELFSQHWPFVWRVLQYFGIRSPDLEDLGQEVFLVVHKRLGDYDPSRPVRPWLAGICRHVAAAHKRRAYVRREMPDDSLNNQVGWTQGWDVVESRDALRRLDEVLAHLPEEQRVVFLLHRVEQMPMGEVAAMLECPVQTGYSRYRAAIQRIQTAFEDNTTAEVADA